VSEPLQPTDEQSLFAPTRWSVVLTAKDKSSPQSAAALEELCRMYWYPLYAYIRRQGRGPHDAEDLTQSFFARLIEKEYLKAAAPEKGRFRTFLRVALKRFLANEWDRSKTLKRGGGFTTVPLDSSAAEDRYQNELSNSSSPERIYERRWAMACLEQTMARLRSEYDRLGKIAEFEVLKAALTAERGAIPYGAMATALEMKEGAARVSVHRLRKRFREEFRAVVSETVSTPEDTDDEMRYLVSILRD
jgi:RNA polymerase sigma-70 factor (ECF subfamily)